MHMTVHVGMHDVGTVFLFESYLVCFLLLQTVAAGRPEPLSSKVLEKCLSLIAAKPVVPGHGQLPLFLPSGLEQCQGLTETAALRK